MHSTTTDNLTQDQPAPGDRQRMRIGELARAAGVSRETIHFYLRENLLPPPEKVNARVAYFDAGHLARIRLIKRLQQVHQPLSAIKEHLQFVEERPAEFIEQHFLPRLVEFLRIDGDEGEISLDEIARGAGLTTEQVARLKALGVLHPTVADGQPYYTQADKNAAAAAKILLDQGVDLEDLRFIRRYAELIEQENGFILHHLILPAQAAGRRDQVSAKLGYQALQTIEDYLRFQIRRDYGLVRNKMADIPDPLENR